MVDTQDLVDSGTAVVIPEGLMSEEQIQQTLHALEQRVAKCELWAAGHEGRVDEKWRNQEATNAMILAVLTKLGDQMTGIGRKVWAGVGVCGTLAVAGGFFGGYLAG